MLTPPRRVLVLTLLLLFLCDLTAGADLQQPSRGPYGEVSPKREGQAQGRERERNLAFTPGGDAGELEILQELDVAMLKEAREERRKEESKVRRRLARLRKMRRTIKEEIRRRKRQKRLNKKTSRPNIVFIIADDLGYNDVPWHNPDIKAPELLRLARYGVTLENHYVLPLCTPSRSALLTGRYPFRYGRQASFSPLSPTGLNTSLTLLPQRLRQLGYKTHLIGKWHLGYCSWEYTPTYRGFDSFYGFYLGSQDYYNRYKELTPTKPKNRNDVTGKKKQSKKQQDRNNRQSLKNGALRRHKRNNRKQRREEDNAMQGSNSSEFITGGYDFRSNEMPLRNTSGVYSSELYASRAEEVIRRHAAGGAGPLFLVVSLQGTHGPLVVPRRYLTEARGAPLLQNPARRTFHGMVAALDWAVGRVVRQLRHSGLYHNTLIVFSSDNGGNIRAGGNNFPLRGSKGGLFEGGTRGVSLVHSPLLPRIGYKYTGLMHVVDWHDTLLHVAQGTAFRDSQGHGTQARRAPRRVGEMEATEEVEGKDGDGVNMWSAILSNEPSPRSSFVYNVRKGPLRGAIRRRDWKLVVGGGGRFDGWVPPEDVGWKGRMARSWHAPKTHHGDVTRHPNDVAPVDDVTRTDDVMLFNLRDDPLETTDVSLEHPEVVGNLKEKLRSYARVSRHPHAPAQDPRGHPRLHGGHFSPGWCDPVV